MIIHPFIPGQSTAETILSMLRLDRQFTPEEARMLDIMLCIHAEHGGGNNSTFAARVLSSTGTDIYSSISAAVGSLKGPKHGGANIKVDEMFTDIKNHLNDWNDDDEIKAYLEKILKKEAGDGSGLIYGMGHAIYTKSDPRAVLLKKYAKDLAKENGFESEFNLLEKIEKLSPAVFTKVTGIDKTLCANVDMYSGLVYRMMRIPTELFTPLFATARVAGWCAHRIEENLTGGRIIRPAYKTNFTVNKYVPISRR